MELQTEASVRLACFFGVLAAMAVWEALAPRRHLTVRRGPRWLSNLALAAINTVAVRLASPMAAVGLALLAEERGWGLFNQIAIAYPVAVVASVILLDLAIYLQHVLFHAVPALWRLHKVHHADLDFDVTTGLRFHTLEILLSLGIKAGVIAVLGPPALGVLLFEVLLNATSMFNHSNVRMPAVLDRILRWVVVTPDMHRVHHSVIHRETNSNYGFNLPWWDRLLGTYRSQPEAGHLQMTIGLEEYRDERLADRLHWMLALPFVDGAAAGDDNPKQGQPPGG
jgi:sterol desaturase/sphingolipid hydroxylase (fatty acid hydroxylase superfamily)